MADDYLLDPSERQEKQEEISAIDETRFSLPSLPHIQIEIRTDLNILKEPDKKQLAVLSVEVILVLYTILALLGHAPFF